MAKPKRSKKFNSRANAPDLKSARSRKSTRDDLVGNFLLSGAIAFLSAFISLAVTNQINWLVVLLVFLIALFLLDQYQRSS
jgi:Flp pilus assembly protein TadB